MDYSIKEGIVIIHHSLATLTFERVQIYDNLYTSTPLPLVFPSLSLFLPHCSLFSVFIWVNALIAVPRTSGLQASNHPHKDRKERAMREKEREGNTKGKGELYKMP